MAQISSIIYATCMYMYFLSLSLSPMLSHRCEKRQQSREQSGGTSYQELEEDILDEEGMIDESKLGPPFGIVINGHSLVSHRLYIHACVHVRVRVHVHVGQLFYNNLTDSFFL